MKASFQQNSQSYTTAATLVGSMATEEPSLTWTTGNSTAQGTISVSVAADGNGVVLAAQSKNNQNCWYAVDNSAARSNANAPYTNLAGYTPAANAAAPSTGCRRPPRRAMPVLFRRLLQATCSRAPASRRARNQGLTAEGSSLSLEADGNSECAPLRLEGGTFVWNARFLGTVLLGQSQVGPKG